MIRHGALHRLADPPGRIRRELVATAPVELLDGAVEAERALLDQVQEGDAEAPIALGDGDDQAQVRLDHAPLGGGVAPLDCLGEGDLLRGGEQLVAADIGQEELKAVCGAREDVRLRLGGLLFLFSTFSSASGWRTSSPIRSSSRVSSSTSASLRSCSRANASSSAASRCPRSSAPSTSALAWSESSSSCS